MGFWTINMANVPNINNILCMRTVREMRFLERFESVEIGGLRKRANRIGRRGSYFEYYSVRF